MESSSKVVLEPLNNDGTVGDNEDMKDTLMMTELSKVLETPGVEINSNREFFDAPQQELENEAYSQKGCAHAKEFQGAGVHVKESHTTGSDAKKPCASASHSHSVPPQRNVGCPLIDDEDIFVDDEAVSVENGLRAVADAQEAARENQSEEPRMEPIFYSDTSAAQVPVDDKADVKLNIVYDKENPRIKVNEYFPSMEDFRLALRQHGIQKGFQVHKVKTDKTRFRGSCKAEGCPWRIVAHKLRDLPAVVITMIPEEHNCVSSSNLTSMTSQNWVAERVVGWLRENPDLGAKELQEKLHEVYSVDVNYATVWAGRQKAMNKIFQSWEDTFQELYNFRAELLSICPGSFVEISTKMCGDDVHFDKLFFALQPCIDGFKNGCRPDIAFEFTALDGMYSGKLACACALDGHNSMYPVAWAIFYSNSNDNWTWFMEQLKMAIGNLPGLTISADKCMGFGDNNLAESFYEWIMNIKGMPVVDLVDRLRQMTMEVWYKRRCIGNKLSGIILPAVIEELNDKVRSLRNIEVCICGLQTAEVSGNSQDMTPWRHVVDLNKHTCSCGEWQLTRKPCLHALAWINTETDACLESFVDDYYSVERFKAAYSGIVPPMTGRLQWRRVDPGFKLLAPPSKQRAGKRKYKTKASQESDANEQHQCKLCGELEHHEKDCTLHCLKKRKRCQAKKEERKAEEGFS